MRILAGLLVLSLAWAAPAWADHYYRTKSMGGMEMENWATSKKQRTQATVPVMGQFILITRLDKGVEWTIDPKGKMYDEKPIALPYTKETARQEDELTPEEQKEAERLGGVAADCTQVIHDAGQRNFAGYPAKGFYSACKEGEDASMGRMTMWMAVPTGPLKQMAKEHEEFSKEKARLTWSNYPGKERKELEQGMEMMRKYFGKAMSGSKMPDGVPLAMETSGAGEGGMNGMFYEVTELKIQKIQPQIFDLPPGYRRVENLAQEQANAMMREMGVDTDQMQKMMQGMQLPQGDDQDE